MKNQTLATGRLKNIRQFDQYGLMVIGQLTQRDERSRATFTIPIVTHDPAIASVLLALAEQQDEAGYTPEVEIKGQLSTKFDKRQNVDNADRKAPITRIMISEVELV